MKFVDEANVIVEAGKGGNGCGGEPGDGAADQSGNDDGDTAGIDENAGHEFDRQKHQCRCDKAQQNADQKSGRGIGFIRRNPDGFQAKG